MSGTGIEPGSGRGSEPPVPELFDIHVMYFVGDPRHIAGELSRAFNIDQQAALRIATDVPVTVKRNVGPDLAVQFLEVLGQLGAQVVLLPCARPGAPAPQPLPPRPRPISPLARRRPPAEQEEPPSSVARGLFSAKGGLPLKPKPTAATPPPGTRPSHPADGLIE